MKNDSGEIVILSAETVHDLLSRPTLPAQPVAPGAFATSAVWLVIGLTPLNVVSALLECDFGARAEIRSCTNCSKVNGESQWHTETCETAASFPVRLSKDGTLAQRERWRCESRPLCSSYPRRFRRPAVSRYSTITSPKMRRGYTRLR